MSGRHPDVHRPNRPPHVIWIPATTCSTRASTRPLSATSRSSPTTPATRVDPAGGARLHPRHHRRQDPWPAGPVPRHTVGYPHWRTKGHVGAGIGVKTPSAPRGSAESVGGCLISGGSGVLVRVRRDPHGDDEGVYSIPSPARSRRRCHLRPRLPCRAGPWSGFSGTWPIPGTGAVRATTCPRSCPWPWRGCWPVPGA